MNAAQLADLFARKPRPRTGHGAAEACRAVLPSFSVLFALISAACVVTDGALEDAVDPDADGVPWTDDCDNADGQVFPGADERCNDLDDDCDGQIDEGGGQTWYRDADGDGFGDPDAAIADCEPPSDAVLDAGDCDDGDPDVYPGAPELCGDGTLNDCAGDPAVAREACGAVEGPLRLSEADARFLGDEGSDYLGRSVVGLPDIDGDGVPDAAIAAYYDDLGGSEAGTVYLVSGAVVGDVEMRQGAWISSYAGANPYDHAGFTIDSLGTDADGQAWLAIGAKDVSFAQGREGEVYLVPATPEVDLNLAGAAVILYGDDPGAELGRSVAPAGLDVSSGRVGVLTGAPFFNVEGSSVGAGFVVKAPAEGPAHISVADTSILGVEAGSQAGSAMAMADIDGDGTPELWISAPGAGGGGTSRGLVGLFPGPVPAGTLSLADATVTWAGTDGELMGDVLAPVGDQDGDGYDDLALGSDLHDVQGESGLITDAGAVCVILDARSAAQGTPNALSDCAWLLEGWEEGQRVGVDVRGGFDADGDRQPDLLIGGPFSDANAGGAWLVYEPFDALESANVHLLGETAGDFAGFSVAPQGASLGDDGFDLWLGAWRHGAAESGAVYRVNLSSL